MSRKKQRNASKKGKSAAPAVDASRWTQWGLMACIALLAVLPYLNALSNDFTLDDLDIVVQNPFIRDLGNVGRFFSSDYWLGAGTQAARADPGLYRPLTVLSFAIDFRLWQLSPRGFHAMNVALHAATSIVVFRAALAVLVSPVAALIAAAIFAVHPIHAEAVTSIVGRAEVLATLLFVLAFVVAVRRPTDDEGDVALPTPARSAAVAVLYLLAVFSKESAATLPLVLLVYDWLHREELLRDRGRGMRALAIRYGSLAVSAVVYLAIRNQAVRGPANIWAGWVNVSAGERVLTALKVLPEYLALLIVPRTLLADYWTGEIPIAHSVLDGGVLLALLVLAAVIGAVVWLRRDRVLTFSVAFFAITLLPVSNLLFPIGVGKAERILYLPSVAFCLVVGWAVLKLVRPSFPRWVAPVLAAPVLLALAARTVRRNADWRDQFTLALATLRDSPTSPLMNDIAGVEFARRGDVDRALRHFSEAARLAPQIVTYRVHLGTVYYLRGRLADAAAELTKAVQAQPNDADAHNGLGLVHLANREFPAAAAEFNTALRLNPNHPDARSNLGTVYLDQGQFDAAFVEFSAAVQTRPESGEAHNNLGVVYMRRGQLEAAAAQFREAARLRPDLANARQNLKSVEAQLAAKR